jgi:hypothetical protein
MDDNNLNGKWSADTLASKPSPKRSCVIDYTDKKFNEFKGPVSLLINSATSMEGVAHEFDSQRSRCRGCPKLQLDVQTVNRYERRCDELKIAVIMAK